MAELWAQGWPDLPSVGPEWTLRRLVKALRNAVAHFNVEFNAEPGCEITSITVWNESFGSDRKPIRGSRGWQTQIAIEDLNGRATLIADQYIESFAPKAA